MCITPRAAALAALLSSPLPAAHAAVYFSEYVEGSSNNKALEIVNTGGEAVNLSGYSVQIFANGGSSASATINLSGSIAPGGAFVLSHASASFAGTANQTSGSLSFNGNDAVTLRNGTAVIDAIGQVGVDPGAAGWGSDPTNTTDNTLRRKAAVTGGDASASDAFDPAVEWLGFAVDTFNGLGCSGEASCGEVPPPPLTRIHDIQGQAHVSPLAGQNVTTRGIVTALRNTAGRGFYLQDPDGDGNAATSDAVFVFTNSAPTVAVGQEVLVTGSVSEFRPGGASTANLSTTQISAQSIQSPSDVFFTNAAVGATRLGAGGRAVPTQVIDDDTTGSVEVAGQTTYDPESDGIDFYESLEGMLIEVANAIVTGPTNRFGEVWVVADAGANATGMNARGGITLVEREAGIDYNPERIQFDDLLFGAMPMANVGDTAALLRGVVSYDFGNFEVLPSAAPAFTDNGLVREVAELPTGGDRLSIANYNVENLDPNDADEDSASSTCNDTDVADGKFEAIAQQIVEHLKGPDIVALQEVQDETGCTDEGITTSAGTLSRLVEAIAAAGGPAYTAFDIAPQDGQDGGQPGGNIRVAYLYNDARVDLVPGTVGVGDADDATQPALDAGGKLALTLSPGRVDPTNVAWVDSRKPLAAVFEFNGHRLVAVNNHWSSKGGGTSLYGHTQPAINGSQDQREQQAAVVNAFVDSVLAVDPQAKVAVLGDLNEFSFLPPLDIVKGGEEPVLVDIVDAQLPPEERYSYVFEGNAQALDHLLVSQSLAQPSVDARADVVHINSEFADQISDHDPDVASFLLPVRVCEGGPGRFRVYNEGHSVIENAGSVTVSVQRLDGACGAAKLSYVTLDGSAKSATDYVGASGSLGWADGESGAKQIAIELRDDSVRESVERFRIVFGAATGATLPVAPLPIVPVTIVDNDLLQSTR